MKTYTLELSEDERCMLIEAIKDSSKLHEFISTIDMLNESGNEDYLKLINKLETA